MQVEWRRIELLRQDISSIVSPCQRVDRHTVPAELPTIRAVGLASLLEVIVIEKEGRIVETATEARQAEPGPSILLILVVSIILAVIVLGVVWFMFFRT
jgi:hypothetical protein